MNLLLAALLFMVMMFETITSFPTGAPRCDVIPSDGHEGREGLFAPQGSYVPHNVIISKTELKDGRWWILLQSDIECPLETTYIENHFVGFLVKTESRGHFQPLPDYKVLECDNWRTKAVTHKERRAKANMGIVFVPIGGGYETTDPEFTIILVKEYERFWVDIKI
eukprot:GFUD01043663.1.p1 GENE.GFUD01043663.1~~GFUD01043663.1.p1  ORF type:complete len:166 (+),score=23.51 GFUD01043663.1:77-574(+)